MSNSTPSTPANVQAAHVVHDWTHSSPLISCRFDPTGKFVFATAQDRGILRWELATGKLVSFTAHDSWVRSLAFSHDGQTLITGGYDQQLIWWPATADKPEPLRHVTAHDGWIRWIAVSPDGRQLASGGNDHQVKLWQLEDGAHLHTFQGHDRHVYSTHYHPSGKWLFSGDLRGVVKKWDVESHSELATLDAKVLYAENRGQGAEYGGVRSMSFDGTGQQLICSGFHKADNPFAGQQEPLIVVLDVNSGATLRSHTAKDGPKCIAWRTLWHRDGFLIGGAGGHAGALLLFWQADAEHEYHRFALPSHLMDMDLHPDGLQVATAHFDGHLRITRLADKAT